MILARFFERRSFKQIAADTGKSEAACKMRTRRSLDKLHSWLSKRGVTIPVAAVTTGLTAAWPSPHRPQ